MTGTVYNGSEFIDAHRCVKSEQDGERNRTGQDAAYKACYKDDSGNASLDKVIFHDMDCL